MVRQRLTSGAPSIGRLIDQQLGKWELARAQRRHTPSSSAATTEDFICLSRLVGVDAHSLAETLGRQLGLPVFGREILEAMAGDDTIRERIYSDMDERDLNWWEESLRAVMDNRFVRNDYFRRLCETVLSLARQSSCIFVGRGTDLILPRDRGLRVRLVASLDTRVATYAEVKKLPLKKAREEVENIEHHRAEFFRRRFRVDAYDPLRHDMILNLDRWNVSEAIALILEAHSRRRRNTEFHTVGT